VHVLSRPRRGDGRWVVAVSHCRARADRDGHPSVTHRRRTRHWLRTRGQRRVSFDRHPSRGEVSPRPCRGLPVSDRYVWRSVGDAAVSAMSHVMGFSSLSSATRRFSRSPHHSAVHPVSINSRCLGAGEQVVSEGGEFWCCRSDVLLRFERVCPPALSSCPPRPWCASRPWCVWGALSVTVSGRLRRSCAVDSCCL
jgi:hypothetical protein